MPDLPTCFARPVVRSPVPPATSSARWPGVQAGERQRELLPEPVRAAGHQVVHQVVVAGNRIEHAAHAALLFVPGNAFVAEIGVGVLVWIGHRAASIDGSPARLRKRWLFRRAFATKPNYSSGGLVEGRWSVATGLFYMSACAANSAPAFGRLRELLLGSVDSRLVLRPIRRRSRSPSSRRYFHEYRPESWPSSNTSFTAYWPTGSTALIPTFCLPSDQNLLARARVPLLQRTANARAGIRRAAGSARRLRTPLPARASASGA